MNDIIILIWFFFCLFLPTKQLFCSTNCSNIQIKYSNNFIEPINYKLCINNTSEKICKGKIIAYYNDKNFPKYINYTFGRIDDILEKKNEYDIFTHGLNSLIKYQIIINATKKETIIIADIYCTNNNQCALDEIKKLFNKYNNQINPFYELKNFIYVDPPPKILHCFDVTSDKIKQCPISNNNPICMSYLKDLKQECSFDSDVHIHEEFIITSPDTFQLNLMNELVKCNKDNCNDNKILTNIQNITRNYADGNILIKNVTNKQRKQVNQIFCICILIFLFFSRI